MTKTAKKSQETQTHSFSAEIAKVLRLMIHSLYTNKDIFLRELISNASDACDKLRYRALTEPGLQGEDHELKIRISCDKDAKIISIRDNGIGMNREDLIAHLGTIAKSGTAEFAEALTGDAKKDMPLIGQFGVGFYSSFMVADKVSVKSRKAGEEQAWLWESEGAGEFTVKALDEALPRGTEITLHLRKDALEYADKYRLSHIAQTYSDHISFPIEFVDAEGNAEQLNKAAALWMRPKAEITEEQYQEFYRHVAHQPDKPWLTLHNQVEGKLSYTNLLFIPSMKPFDLYHPERKRRVKLYVKRVFITDEGLDIVPRYLRFLRGVVDSEDLPLNISRETLQHNPLLDKIRDAITKKVLGELKKKADKGRPMRGHRAKGADFRSLPLSFHHA
jgi:molecular chaperone HtpG